MAKAKKICNYNSTLAVHLRELIKERNTTITNVAGVAKVTRQAVSAYQDGSSQPTADTLKKIAKHFNVSADWLLGLSKVKTTDPKLKEICEYTGLSEEVVNVLHYWKNDKQERVNHLNKLFSLQETKYFLLELFRYCDKCEEYADKVYKKTREYDYKYLHFCSDDKLNSDDNFKQYCDELRIDDKSIDSEELGYLSFKNYQEFMKVIESFQNECLQESKELFTKKLKDGANNG